MARIIFMGTAPFAVPCFEALAEQGHALLVAVSQPDRPHGRGNQLRPTPVKEAALRRGVPVLQPEKASHPEFIDSIRALAPELIVVVAYGQILRPALLDVPPAGCVNVHASLLPELRGAAPIQWSVIRGYPDTGVTTMFMDPGMDTGDMILQASEPIGPAETAGTLSERLAPLGARLLVETVARITTGDAPRQPQDHAAATYAPMLGREDGRVAWKESAVRIRNRIQGCNPAPGAFTTRAGSTLKLWRAEAVPAPADGPPGAPGTVAERAGPELLVWTGEGLLRLLEVQPESRARLPGEEYRRGYHVLPGERWGAKEGDPPFA